MAPARALHPMPRSRHTARGPDGSFASRQNGAALLLALAAEICIAIGYGKAPTRRIVLRIRGAAHSARENGWLLHAQGTQAVFSRSCSVRRGRRERSVTSLVGNRGASPVCLGREAVVSSPLCRGWAGRVLGSTPRGSLGAAGGSGLSPWRHLDMADPTASVRTRIKPRSFFPWEEVMDYSPRFSWTLCQRTLR